MILYRANRATPTRAPVQKPAPVAILDPMSWANETLRKGRHRLYVERIGRLVMVHIEDLPGLSFGLPPDTPAGRIVVDAVNGARARRAFIYGSSEERKAA